MPGKKILRVSAPGKIILSGEHAVVYGYPALVAAVDKRLTVDEKLHVSSDIPMGCGMGSSAAYAVAMAAVKLKKLDLVEVNKLAYKMEKKKHGNPSGADNTICTYGGFLWYRKETEDFKVYSPVVPKTDGPRLLIYNTGKPTETTAEMVSLVAVLYKKNPTKTSEVFRNIEAVSKGFLSYLEGKKGHLTELIRENEALLEKLGVVSEATKKLIREIEKIGGAAKVSGAGGRKKDSGIILMYHPNMQKLENYCRRLGRKPFLVKLGEGGVRNE